MSRDERIYRAILRVYPRPFLRAYENEMLVAFRDRRRDDPHRHPPWPALLADIARSAPSAWRDHIDEDLHTGVAAMKAIAVLATVTGVYEILNTIFELAVGGVAGRGGIALLGLALAVAAGAGLVVSGIALIRRGRDAAKLATGASVACFVLFGVAAVTRAGLSGMASLAGLAFPLLFLGFLIFTRSSRAAS
jgi:hypothetical protein